MPPASATPLPLGKPYANPLAFVPLPPAVCTTTGAVPYTELAGAVQAISEGDTTTILFAPTPPTKTVAGEAKFTPRIVSAVPPERAQTLGWTPTITGCPAGGA